ncbi:MAG: metal ABC transporter permease [Spirochaetaceae bacterium]|jgi:zinc transport system permease protein|nr:metal ABC transporter permease [Spirochaetaceae bacterium]
MAELFTMPFFTRSLVVLIAAGISFPVLGTFVLNLELIAARFAVMHAALLGAAIGLLLGVHLSVMAMGAAVLAGIGIALISYRGKVSAGGSLGLIMTVCMGLAFIVFYKSNVQAVTAFSLFWGNILSLTGADVRSGLAVAAGILVFLFACYKEIHIVLYDRELAWAVGVRAKLVYGGIILSVCLGIAVAMRITGALLVDAVTLLPALAARSIGRSFRALILLGMLFGLAMNISGFALSFALDLPVSSGIAVVGALAMLVLQGLKLLRGKS